MLGTVGVDHGQACAQVVHQHDGRLRPAQRCRDPVTVLGRGDEVDQQLLDPAGQLGRAGHQDRRRGRSVLGLGDEVRRDVPRVGGAVGQDGDLGGPGLRVDPDRAAHQPLGGRDVLVARAGDDVDRLAQHGTVLGHLTGGAVGEHRDRLRATDRVHLLHAEQAARRQDRGVRQPVGLRRADHHERRHAGLLRGHHVHHHRRRVHREPAGHVQAHPAHGHPPLAHHRAGLELDPEAGRALLRVHRPGPADRDLQTPRARSGRGPRARPRGRSPARAGARVAPRRTARSGRAAQPRRVRGRRRGPARPARRHGPRRTRVWAGSR